MVLAVGPPLGRGLRVRGWPPLGPRRDSTSTRVEDAAPGETADERHRLLPPTHADVAEDADGVVRADNGVPVRDEHGVHLADAVEQPAAVPDDVLVTEVLVCGDVGGRGSAVSWKISTGGSIRNSLLDSRLAEMSTTIRVSEGTRSRFAKLAKATGKPMTELLDEAADALERRVFFDRFAARYAELRDDANACDEVEAERAGESSSLSDHLA